MRNRGKVALQTVGCKLNQAETELLAEQFGKAGYQLAEPGAEADVYVVNTCTVTHIADRKSRHLLRLAHRRNPNAIVVATGCYAQRAPQGLARIEGVSLVLDNAQKLLLPEVLGEAWRARMQSRDVENPDSSSPGLRTRSLVKVQDGCDDFCSYCIVPRVRGRERSLTPDEVVEVVKGRAAAGFREVVLTGTKIGAYRGDGVSLQGLLESILRETGVERVRLSSLQPQDLTPEFVALWGGGRLCRHLHLPLQSGSDAVLRRMRRRYLTADFRRAVALLREAVPDVAITTDVIVGFPGESEEEFEESYRFCQEMGFSAIHVFPFSPRSGTLAAEMPEQVDQRAKRERSKRMLYLARESSALFRQRFLGRTMMVLWEREAGGIWSGLTDNYLRVFAKSREVLTNRLLPARLTALGDGGVWGELIADETMARLKGFEPPTLGSEDQCSVH